MQCSTPEAQGISSVNLLKYLASLEKERLATHNVILMRHGKIIFEAYWEPFHKEFLHRMYSVTKSVTSLAVGFLEQDGKIRLDDPVGKYFPEEIKAQKDENMRRQTIRDMLRMCTAKTAQNWFEARTDDRVRFYFENADPFSRIPGLTFEYDSSGSFVLCALVERLTGMSMMDYLREKLLDKIGVSREAYMLKCPGGHSWGDSALLCRPRDLLLIAAFVMNKGKWNGEQILNERYVMEAVSCQADNAFLNENELDSQGYGYQIWLTYDNSFFFNGMGCQFAVCVPDKDMILIYNGDNQGNQYAKKVIIDGFFKMVARTAADGPLPPDDAACGKLAEYAASRKLTAAIGEGASPVAEQISGRTYLCGKNQMGITKVRFVLKGNGGVLYYSNAQGDKELAFGFGCNAFSPFPQDGYSDETGSVPSGIRYRCAASAAWARPDTLMLWVQIIDKYFGQLHMQFKFDGEKLGIFMTKTAEDFLDEYQGYAGAVMCPVEQSGSE